MATPIYVLIQANHSETFYLEEEKRRERREKECFFLPDKIEDALEKTGGRIVVDCKSNWSSEWHAFRVVEWPDLESYLKYHELLNKLPVQRYAKLKYTLGIRQTAHT